MAQAKQSARDPEDLKKEVAALREVFGALTEDLRALARAESDNLATKAADRLIAPKASGNAGRATGSRGL